MDLLSITFGAGGLVLGVTGLAWGVNRDLRARRREKRRDEQEARRESDRTQSSAAAVSALRVRREQERRAAILIKLRREFLASHDGLTPQMLAGTEPLPKDWVDTRLKTMGELWRQDAYY